MNEAGNSRNPTEKGKVTILSSVRLLPENCAFYGLQTSVRELRPIPSTFDVSVVQNCKDNMNKHNKENKPERKGRIQSDDNNLNPMIKIFKSEMDSVKQKDINDMDKKIQYLTYEELSKKEEDKIKGLYSSNENKIQNKTYKGIINIAHNIEEEIQNKETYNCGDTVLTRYYKRSWKYYVGVIDKVNLNGNEYDISYYKRNGNKTNVKFVIPKSADHDTVPEINLVKKIELLQISDLPVEYVLMNDEDSIYF